MTIFTRLSIRTKLVIILLAAGLPIALADGFFIVRKYRDDYEKVRQAAISTTRAIAYQHQAQIEGIRNLLTTLSQLPEVRNRDAKACTSLLRNVLRLSPNSRNIGIAGLDGNLFASGLPVRINISDRKYFNDAVRTGRFSAGEYVVSRAVGKPAIHFGLPVTDTAGNTVAVAYTTFDLDRFNAIFDSQDLPPGSTLTLNDHRGTILHSYPPDRRIRPGAGDNPDLFRNTRGPAEEGVFFHTGPDSAKRFIAYKRVLLHPDEAPYLYIRVSIPEKAAFEGLNRLILRSFLVFFLTAALALALIHFLSKSFFLNPIKHIASVARAVTQGDLSVRTGISDPGDELGFLARDIDSMTDTLEQRRRERDRVESSLKSSEEKFRAIFDHMNDAIFIFDTGRGAILDVNQAMCSMFGYTRDEAVRLTIDQISQGDPPFTCEEASEYMRSATAGRPQVFEWLGRKSNGGLFWTEVSMRCAVIGGSDRLIVLVRDITERREAEAEKETLMAQLAQSQKIESVGRLAGGIAHDFNNLLTPIIGYSEILKRDYSRDDSMADMTGCILLAADKAKTLVQQLLSFSRKQILDMRPLDLNNVIASFFEILRRTIPENIDIRLGLMPGRCGIRADRNQIEQVLMNLAVNARDAIEGNGVIMIETAEVVLDEEYARLHAGARPGRYALLAFSDTGCGMDEETAKRIFEPFFTTKEVGQGSGLGLSTVYGLIKQHGGYIWVYSEPGRGTTFKMYFPLVDAGESGEPAAGSGTISVNGEGRTVLLVEDNDMVRSMVKALLLSYGFEVHVARDPRQALQLAAGKEFDLLVSDVVMPEMTGPELLEHLLTTQPLLKALFMSGYTASMAARHGMNRTGVKFIQKPFAINDFLHTIDSMLDQD